MVEGKRGSGRGVVVLFSCNTLHLFALPVMSMVSVGRWGFFLVFFRAVASILCSPRCLLSRNVMYLTRYGKYRAAGGALFLHDIPVAMDEKKRKK